MPGFYWKTEHLHNVQDATLFHPHNACTLMLGHVPALGSLGKRFLTSLLLNQLTVRGLRRNVSGVENYSLGDCFAFSTAFFNGASFKAATYSANPPTSIPKANFPNVVDLSTSPISPVLKLPLNNASRKICHPISSIGLNANPRTTMSPTTIPAIIKAVFMCVILSAAPTIAIRGLYRYDLRQQPLLEGVPYVPYAARWRRRSLTLAVSRRAMEDALAVQAAIDAVGFSALFGSDQSYGHPPP